MHCCSSLKKVLQDPPPIILLIFFAIGTEIFSTKNIVKLVLFWKDFGIFGTENLVIKYVLTERLLQIKNIPIFKG